MRYLKPVNRKLLKQQICNSGILVDHPQTIEAAIVNFEKAGEQFSNRQFINLISNIVSERAEKRGGGQFMDALVKELEIRKPLVMDFKYS